MAVSDSRFITICLSVTVHVDPADDELLDRYDESDESFSVANIVSNEVRSNLESLSYVRYVSIEATERRTGT